jgi:hypothetical protein
MRAGIVKKTDETKASPNAPFVGPRTYFLPIAFWFYFFRDDLHSDDCKFPFLFLTQILFIKLFNLFNL